MRVHGALQALGCGNRTRDGVGQFCRYAPLPDNKLRCSRTKTTGTPGEITAPTAQQQSQGLRQPGEVQTEYSIAQRENHASLTIMLFYNLVFRCVLLCHAGYVYMYIASLSATIVAIKLILSILSKIIRLLWYVHSLRVLCITQFLGGMSLYKLYRLELSR